VSKVLISFVLGLILGALLALRLRDRSMERVFITQEVVSGKPAAPQERYLIKTLHDTVRVNVCVNVPSSLAESPKELKSDVGLVHAKHALRFDRRYVSLTWYDPYLQTWRVDRYSLGSRFSAFAFVNYDLKMKALSPGIMVSYNRVSVIASYNGKGLAFGLGYRIF
jgi:hypothetical protein